MRVRHVGVVGLMAVWLSGCGSDSATEPTRTELVRETLTGSIASSGATCSATFQQSVDASYYTSGTQRCAEIPRTSSTAGEINARLTWTDPRIDLDLVLNDGRGGNYRQSIAANRCCETIAFTINPRTSYTFVIYLRGVDGQFLANGGQFSGSVATAYTLTIERPK